MDASTVDADTSEQIELCESYLVCGMFEEAEKLASSILDNAVRNCYEQKNLAKRDVMESAAMVLVQSLGELGRASEILNQVKDYFGAVKGIPVQVLLAGACIQVSKSVTAVITVQEFVEDFLANWQLGDHGYLIPPGQSANSRIECENYVLGVDEYLQVAEFYALAVLGTVKKVPYTSISWVESAPLPEEARQDLLRRLQSMCSGKTTMSSPQIANGSGIMHIHKGIANDFQSLPRTFKVHEPSHEEKCVPNWPNNLEQCFCWLQNRMPKIEKSGTRIHILLGCFVFVVCYILRKKLRLEVMRYIKIRVISLKKALRDFWQLAFSYQVNPLAAVQTLPSTNVRN